MVESVGSVGKAVVNGMSNYLSTTQTDKSHGSSSIIEELWSRFSISPKNQR